MKKILIGLMTIALAAMMAVGSAFAFFSDTEISTGNTLAAGTLNMVVTGGTQNGDSVTATWTSPPNWGPGGALVGDLGTSEVGRLLLHNSGSLDAMYLRFIFTSSVGEGQNPESETTGGDIRDKIIVRELRIGIDHKTAGWDVVGTIAGRRGDNQLPLTLKELTEELDGLPRPVKVRGSTGADYSAGILAGGYSNFQMTFEFAPDAGNQYQGDTATLTVEVTAVQSWVGHPTWPPPGSLGIELSPGVPPSD